MKEVAVAAVKEVAVKEEEEAKEVAVKEVVAAAKEKAEAETAQ